MKETSSGGIGFLGLLTILFIGLKLTGYINWSWWWVLSPIWIPIAVVLVVIVIALIISAFIDSARRRRRRFIRDNEE